MRSRADRQRELFFCLMLAAISLPATPAHAYRPFRTEDAGVAGKDVAQLEVSWDYTQLDRRVGTRHLVLLAPIYGLTRRLEVSVEVPLQEERTLGGDADHGLGDVTLVLKTLLREEGKSAPAVAIRNSIKLDNGDFDRGLGSGDENWTLLVAATRSFKHVIAHAHLGHSWVGNDRDIQQEDTWRYSAGVEGKLNDKVSLMGEISGNEHELDFQREDPEEWRVGVIWYRSASAIFDASIRRGFSGEPQEWTAAVGVAWTF